MLTDPCGNNNGSRLFSIFLLGGHKVIAFDSVARVQCTHTISTCNNIVFSLWAFISFTYLESPNAPPLWASTKLYYGFKRL